MIASILDLNWDSKDVKVTWLNPLDDEVVMKAKPDTIYSFDGFYKDKSDLKVYVKDKLLVTLVTTENGWAAKEFDINMFNPLPENTFIGYEIVLIRALMWHLLKS